jgi:hypothetical protein
LAIDDKWDVRAGSIGMVAIIVNHGVIAAKRNVVGSIRLNWAQTS